MTQPPKPLRDAKQKAEAAEEHVKRRLNELDDRLTLTGLADEALGLVKDRIDTDRPMSLKGRDFFEHLNRHPVAGLAAIAAVGWFLVSWRRDHTQPDTDEKRLPNDNMDGENL